MKYHPQVRMYTRCHHKTEESEVPLQRHLQNMLFYHKGLRVRKKPAISGDLLSAVISIRCILGFRKDNPNVFNMLVQNLPITSGIKCICY